MWEEGREGRDRDLLARSMPTLGAGRKGENRRVGEKDEEEERDEEKGKKEMLGGVDTRRGEKRVRDDGDDERCGIDEGSAEEKSNEKLRSRKTRIEKGRGARKIERRTRGR